MAKSKTNFGSKMGRHLQHSKDQESGKSYSYVSLPKDVKGFSLDDDIKEIRIDIMPYIVSDKRHPDFVPPDVACEGDPWWRRPFGIHRNVGADDTTVVCLRSAGKKCPICEHRTKLIKDGADKEIFKEFYPRPRALYVVVPIAFKKFKSKEWEEFEEQVPFIWDISTKNFEEYFREVLEEDEDNWRFPNLTDGLTLELSMKWESIGKNTTFPTVNHVNFLDREPYDEDVVNDMPDLDKVLIIKSYEEVEAMFFDMDDEQDAGRLNEVEDDTPPERERKSLRTPKETEKKEDPPEEEKDETPRRSLRKPANEETPRKSLSKKQPEVEESGTGKNRCEFGHQFGVDAMDFPECENDCKIWSECLKVKDKNQR